MMVREYKTSAQKSMERLKRAEKLKETLFEQAIINLKEELKWIRGSQQAIDIKQAEAIKLEMLGNDLQRMLRKHRELIGKVL